MLDEIGMDETCSIDSHTLIRFQCWLDHCMCCNLSGDVALNVCFTTFAFDMYPLNPLLTIVTTQASKQESTPEWKAEITLFDIL